MPDRSVKMKRRIFGFQRRVWWPKCTPASSSSRIEATAIVSPSWFGWRYSGGAPGAPTARAGTRALGRYAGSWDENAGILAVDREVRGREACVEAAAVHGGVLAAGHDVPEDGDS